VRPSLYDAVGGADALVRLTAAHHARCLADPELEHPFSHDDLHPEHVGRLAAYLGEALGGPPVFSSTCGDQAAVLRMHGGHGDMSDLGRRFLACFVAAFDDAGLPRDAELRAALTAYMQWAVDDVLAHDDPAAVPADVPMPRWSWNGLQSG
jgi:hemoglobin